MPIGALIEIWASKSGALKNNDCHLRTFKINLMTC